MPTIPPKPCTPTTSSASSYPAVLLSQVAAQYATSDDTMPMTTAPNGPTQPAAGVMAASPAMAPVANPSALGLPFRIHSIKIHTKAATLGDICVTTTAMAA